MFSFLGKTWLRRSVRCIICLTHLFLYLTIESVTMNKTYLDLDLSAYQWSSRYWLITPFVRFLGGWGCFGRLISSYRLYTYDYCSLATNCSWKPWHVVRLFCCHWVLRGLSRCSTFCRFYYQFWNYEKCFRSCCFPLRHSSLVGLSFCSEFGLVHFFRAC